MAKSWAGSPPALVLGHLRLYDLDVEGGTPVRRERLHPISSRRTVAPHVGVVLCILVLAAFSAGSGTATAGTPAPLVDSGSENIPILISDFPTNRIIRMTDLAGSNWEVGPTENGLSFNGPMHVFVDSRGRIYVADRFGNRIVRMDDVAGRGWKGFGGVGPKPFWQCSSIAVDPGGVIYVTDAWSRIVRIDDMDGAGWTTFGPTNSGPGSFNNVKRVLLDAQGRLYVSDTDNHRIDRFEDMQGTGWTTFGSFGSGVGQFNRPEGLAIDALGRIYATDNENNRIVRIDDMTGAGWVSFGSYGSGIGQLIEPHDIAVSDSKIYIADTGNFRIVRIDDMTGAGWTTLGSNGPGTFQFMAPKGIRLAPPPILAPSSSAVDDSGGNNNGVIDFNECVGLTIVLQNRGAADATGVNATLTTTTTGVTVVSPGSPYPDIAAGSTGANTVPFRIGTSPGFVPGTIIDLALQVATAQGPFNLALKLDTGTPDPAAATFGAAGPVPIPDDNPAGASLPLSVSGITTAISKVRATVYITHTFDADLTIQLIAPDGTTITLAGGVGGSGDNFGTDCPADGNDTVFDDAAPTSILAGAAPFVGSFRPVGALSAFKGKSGAAVNGTWTLKVIDGSALNTGNIECWSLSINGTLSTDGGGRCPSIQTPASFVVDVHSGAGTVSNLNGVVEPGESVAVEPAWQNQDVIPRAVTGAASSFTGPPGATYTLDDASAGYGTIAPAATNNCFDAAGDCYRMTVSNPATRPSTHWDATFSEGLSTAINKIWRLHIGGSFTDVPTSHMFYRFIETIFHKGVTSGCSATGYCPADATKRKQMAVFLLRAKLGGGYVPPPATGTFGDVPANDFFAPWIEDLYNRGITSGCSASPLLYCPEAPVTRRQMAVFLLRTLLGSSYTPPPCTNPTFADVACGDAFADWIYDLAARGITSGCGGGNYCPGSSVTRGQMAAFLTRTFSLLLYGP